MLRSGNVFMEAEKYSQNNRRSLEASSQCGCYHCEELFFPTAVVEWDGDTALCPNCNFDTVIGDRDRSINAVVLRSLKTYWF